MKYWAYDFSKLVCWLVFRVGFGLEVRGQAHVPRQGPFILASNHVSFLDPPLVGVACLRPVSFMARADLYQHRVLGAWLRSVRAISVERGEADQGAIRAALSRLRQGEGVAIFPEGVRQRSGHLGAARRGVGLLAEMAKAPVIPVFVKGTFEALPPDAHSLHRAKIRVAFGPAISYTNPSFPSTSTSGGAGERSSRVRHERIAEAVTHAWRRLEESLTG